MNAPMTAPNVPQVARLRVEDFMLLNDAGAFADYGKTELIEGEIIYMNAQYSRHARIKSDLMVELANALRASGSAFGAWCEVSIKLSLDSMPEPDIVVTSYRGTGPVPLKTVAMIVEVSDTTLDIDFGRKLGIYAQAQVPEYWVIDLNGGRAIRMSEPSGNEYARRDETPLGERVESATISGLAVVTER